MALNWNWNDKMGEFIFEDETEGDKVNIYKGNAYMICVIEHPDGYYDLGLFFADKEHMKNCIGLGPKEYGTDNLIERACIDWNVDRIRLNTKYKHVPEIVSLLAKAKTNVTIELYYEEGQN